ncbi:cytochrome c oxidase assembly protein [Pseudonocardia sp. KRD291]|uniref:cytochrome c oxidase assembly protein n=1 Tax=Pseudonocardia sp. KRD291 TaxID=2792007 RepID=UPI001C49ED45|nr:cytochrome c oxidase assembly protein [Pseudonocardia sp. KRD291]
MGGHATGGHVVSGSTVVAAALLVPAVAYGVAVLRARGRGRAWPWWRTVFWLAGLAAAAVVLAGPLAERAHTDFRVHMLGHLLLGMLAPLLLVWAAPVTLAMRALPVGAARALSRALRSAPARVLTHPVVAAVLDVGGLWVLYRTGLYAASTTDPALHLLVHAHVLLAGCLFVASIAGPDPAPHRSPPVLRAAVLVLATAAHDILSKTIYADPPDGVTAAAAEAAGQLMYYGGLPVELALAVLLCREWLGRGRAGSRQAGPHGVGSRRTRPHRAGSRGVGPRGTVLGRAAHGVGRP